MSGLLKLRLHSLTKSWGGQLVRVTSDQLRELGGNEQGKPYKDRQYFDAPFVRHHTLGILFHDFRVLYTTGVHWAAIIHELGHVFATTEHPGRADEWSFFGWEYAVAKHIKGSLDEWVVHNEDYGVEGGTGGMEEFGDLSVEGRQKRLNERRNVAMKIGLIDAHGRPQAIRRGKTR